MIDSGSWFTNRNRQKRRPATMRILQDFEVFAVTSRMFENKLSGLWPFYLKNKESDRRATMASNIAEVQLKKNIVFVRCEALVFEVCIWGWRIYWCFVLVSLQFVQPRVSCSCSSTWLTKVGRVSQRCPRRTEWWEPRSSSQLQGQKMLSEGRVRRIHTHTLYILPAFMDDSGHRYPFVILIPLFFVFFFLPLNTKRLRGESTFRPEPLRKPSTNIVNSARKLPASTSNFPITLKKYTQIYR